MKHRKEKAWSNLMNEQVCKRGLCFLFAAVVSLSSNASLDSWQWIRPSPAAYTLRDIVSSSDLLVVVGNEGIIQTSPDGQTWTRRYSGVTNDLSGIASAPGKFVAVGNYGVILTSTNGLLWESVPSPTWQDLGGIAYGNGVFVAFTEYPPYQIFTSSNLADWIAHPYTNRITLRKVRFCGNRFIGTGAYGIVCSTNGANWTTGSLQTKDLVYDVIHSDDMFVAVGESYSQVSKDCFNWSSHWIGSMQCFALCHTGSNFVAIGWDIISKQGMCGSSSNGTNWTVGPVGTAKTLLGAAYHCGNFIGIGAAGTIMGSTNATNWKTISGNEANLNRITKIDDNYYALGETGRMLVSSNTTQWTKLTTPTTMSLHAMAKGGGVFIAVGAGVAILSRNDAVEPA